MAHLFRPQKTYYVDAAGKRVPAGTPAAKKVTETARKWYGKGPPIPKGKAVPLAADRRAALQMLAKLEQQIERGETAIGGSEIEASKRPIEGHIEDYLDHLRSKDDTPEHVALTGQRIRTICTACAFAVPRDIKADSVADYLSERRKVARKDGGLSVASSNYYLTAIKGFCRWMTRTRPRRLSENPLDVLQGGNIKTDRHHDRRALTPEQLLHLLSVTRESPRVFRHQRGPDRLMLYLTAASTGFRCGELAELTPESFRLDDVPPAVILGARDDKSRKPVVQPLPPGLVEPMREYLSNKSAGQPVWLGRWQKKGAQMLRLDLAAAGIPYVVDGPDGKLFADFHSLRHSFIALLDQAGVSLKQAMQLARHSDPKLTMARYGRAQLADLGIAVGRLPELAAPRGAAEKPLDALPPDLLRALAVLGLGALAAGWYGAAE